MIKTITAPESYENLEGKFIFLAGTIDNGESEDWQAEVSKYAEGLETTENVYILNPRRNDWNPNATEKDIEDQIKWELGALKRSEVIIMNILESSKSPISLLEMGLFGKDNPGFYVFCGPGFYRYTNVRVTAEEFGIKHYSDYTTDDIKKLIKLIV
ncbi:MAG: nucleoside 2-deoxyribosyltransferase domain-containing protein [Bacilli bacterium]|nr:nucleoside 2-deoxyribosyltransferase domain-containing protein [Bacilli bacterium]